MKDKKVMLIAGGGAVVLLGVLAYAFFGSSGNDVGPGSPYSTDSGDPSSLDDAAAESPTRRAVPNQAGSSSSRLSAADDSSDTEEGEDEAVTQKKKRKNRKGRKGYSNQSDSGEEEETENRSKKTIRSQNRIPLGGG